MGLLELVLISVGLSMDAFAVSITLGLSCKNLKIEQYLIPGIYFGFFQAAMPVIGYYAGILFSAKIQGMDHWIAFVLLGFIGGKAIYESLKNKKESTDALQNNKENCDVNHFKFITMFLLAIATSIDALIAGVTFAFFNVKIINVVLVIGFTTFCFSVIGVKIGRIFGAKFKTKAEITGGIILVLLGFKILIEHLLAMNN